MIFLHPSYIAYFNQLCIRDPLTQEQLTIGEDGRSGSGYAYVMNKLNESAEKFLQKLKNHELEEKYSPEDYLSGNYEYKTAAPMYIDETEEMPLLGNLVSRRPKVLIIKALNRR